MPFKAFDMATFLDRQGSIGPTVSSHYPKTDGLCPSSIDMAPFGQNTWFTSDAVEHLSFNLSDLLLWFGHPYRQDPRYPENEKVESEKYNQARV
jgi:hypothetical protein